MDVTRQAGVWQRQICFWAIEMQKYRKYQQVNKLSPTRRVSSSNAARERFLDTSYSVAVQLASGEEFGAPLRCVIQIVIFFF